VKGSAGPSREKHFVKQKKIIENCVMTNKQLEKCKKKCEKVHGPLEENAF